MLVAAVAKLRAPGDAEGSIGLLSRPLIWRGLILAELAAAGLALSPISLIWPTALLLLVFGLGQIWMGVASPGMRCACFGNLDPNSTYSVPKGLFYLGLAAMSVVVAVGADSVQPSVLDAVIARVVGGLIPLAVLGSSIVRDFREVFG